MGFLLPNFHKKIQRIILSLENLLDVTITSAANNDLLRYDGTKWVNVPTPTWNQNTTGNAATATYATSAGSATTATTAGHAITADSATTAGTATTALTWTSSRLLAGNSVNGSANVAFSNKFIVQGTTDAGLSGAQFLGALSTGILKNTTTTGVLTIAGGADLPTMTSTVGGAVPTPPNNTTTFLRGDGTWAAVSGASGGTVTNTAGALTASALVVGNAASDIKVLSSLGTTSQVLKGNAAGLPSWGTVSYSELSGTVPTWNQNTTGSSASCTGNAATATVASSCSGNAATATTAGNLSGTPTVPNGTAATTQSYGDATTKLATNEFVDRLRDVPASTSTTLVIGDRGKSIDGTANISIPTNASVAFPIGSTVSVCNTGSSTLTIAAVTPATTTLRLAGTTTTGTRTLAAYGMATMRKVATDEWLIAGAGLT